MKYLRVTDHIGHYQRVDLILQKTFRLSERQRLKLSFIHQNALGTNHDFNDENDVTDRTFAEINYQFD
ncbi:MAG: hypothetical protein ACU833_04215, partial [Gammaproteobacteria bacterium]